MLQELPLEVQRMIFKQITDFKDLKSLCEVSKRLHQAAIPALYETLKISLKEEELRNASVECSLLRRGKKYWGLVKGIALEAPFQYYLERRCPKNECSIRFSGDSILVDTLMDVFGSLTDNSLRRFSWNLRTCIPAKVLGESGYLAKRQKKIEHLSFVTDHSCQNAFDGQCTLDLSHFNCLRTLSWRCLRSVQDSEALRDCLKLNTHHLEDLTIDLTGWEDGEDENIGDWFPGGNEYRSPNFFVRDILGLSRGELNRMLPRLRYLFLHKVSFDSAIPETLCALNFSELRALKLWNCPFSYQLLEAVTKSDMAVRLTSFEVVADDYHEAMSDLGDFLKSFQGLENLYLMLGSAEWKPIGEGILHHKSTLRRLVIHERDLDFNEVESEGEMFWHKELETMLQETSLECLGMSYQLRFLRGDLARFSRQPTCKILHVRSSRDNGEKPGFPWSFDALDDNSDTDSDHPTEAMGIDPLPQGSPRLPKDEKKHTNAPLKLLRLAQWAFGAQGLQELQILAYGDFSHQGRYAQHTRLFCRNQPSPLRTDFSVSEVPSSDWTFRYVRKDDRELQELLSRNLGMLEACAVEPILKYF